MNNRLTQAVRAQRRQTQPSNQLIAGSLGIFQNAIATVEVPNRPSYVYVRVRNSTAEVIQAFNAAVSPVYDLPVFIQWQGNRYVVIERDTMRYSNWIDSSAYLPRHASTHEFRGSAGDVVFMSQEQFLPLSPMPSGSLGSPSLLVNDYNLMLTTGSFSYSPVQSTVNLTQWNPSTTGAVMVLVALDAQSGGLVYTVGSGSVFGNWLTGTADVLPHVPVVSDISRYMPIAAVRLITGTSRITWANLYDLRPFFGVFRGAGGGGGGGGGGGTGSNDATYLRLDATNSPVTGPLDIQSKSALLPTLHLGASGSAGGLYVDVLNPNSIGGVYVSVATGTTAAMHVVNQETDAPGLQLDQFLTSGPKPTVFTQPTLLVNHFQGITRANFSEAAIVVNTQLSNEPGGVLRAQFNGGQYYTVINPWHTGTFLAGVFPFPSDAPYHYDTRNSLKTGQVISEWLHNTEIEYWMTKDGRMAMNQLMIRERTVAGSIHSGNSFSMGDALLTAGTVTIKCGAVTMSSRIFLTIQNGSGANVGTPYVYSRMNGSGFTVLSTNLSDVSRIAWLVVEPA